MEQPPFIASEQDRQQVFIRDVVSYALIAEGDSFLSAPLEQQNQARALRIDYYTNFMKKGFIDDSLSPRLVANPAFVMALETVDIFDAKLRPQLEKKYFSKTETTEPPGITMVTINKHRQQYESIMSDYVILQTLRNLNEFYNSLKPSTQAVGNRQKEIIEMTKKINIEELSALGTAVMANYLPQDATISLRQEKRMVSSYSLQKSFYQILATFDENILSPDKYIVFSRRLEQGSGIVDQTEDIQNARDYIPVLCHSLGDDSGGAMRAVELVPV